MIGRLSSLICQECGGPFEGWRSDAKYCSESCRAKVDNRTRATAKTVWMRQKRGGVTRDAWKASVYRSPEEQRLQKNATRALWRAANPDKVKDEKHRRRARKYGGEGMRLLKAKIWEAVDGLCGLCGIEVPLTEMTIDHILPLVLGGNHVYSNVQPAHYDCNVHRGIRPLAGCAA